MDKYKICEIIAGICRFAIIFLLCYMIADKWR